MTITFMWETAMAASTTRPTGFRGGQGGMCPQSCITFKVTLPKGTYTLYCHLPGHAALGMRNHLIVT